MLSRTFMTVKDVSDLLQVGETTIRNWIHNGDLTAIDVGREWRIAPKDLEAFIEARRSSQTSHSLHKATGKT
jgi:excisionase family DNA binding protein